MKKFNYTMNHNYMAKMCHEDRAAASLVGGVCPFLLAMQ